MAVPARLSKKLRDVFGDDASEDIMTVIEELRSQHNEVLAAVHRTERALQSTERALIDRIQSVEIKLSERIGDVKADLMKWSFLFWVGAVAAIAMLAGVLGR